MKYLSTKILNRILRTLGLYRLIKNPFSVIRAQPDSTYIDLLNNSHSEVASALSFSKYEIDRPWFERLVLKTQVVVKEADLNFSHGPLLYSLVRDYCESLLPGSSINIFEFGTARGFSSVMMARALTDSDTSGRVYTVDILQNRTPFFWNSFGDERGKRSRLEILEEYGEDLSRIIFLCMQSKELSKAIDLSRIHFAFLDSVHDYRTVATEFRFVASRQMVGDYIVFDDVDQDDYPGVYQFIENLMRQDTYKLEVLEASQKRHYCVARKVK